MASLGVINLFTLIDKIENGVQFLVNFTHVFLFYPCYPCFSGALIFRKNKKCFVWVVFTRITTIISCAPRHFVLQKELKIHQIFHLLSKKIKKNIKRCFFQPNNFEKLYPIKIDLLYRARTLFWSYFGWLWTDNQ